MFHFIQTKKIRTYFDQLLFLIVTYYIFLYKTKTNTVHNLSLTYIRQTLENMFGKIVKINTLAKKYAL